MPAKRRAKFLTAATMVLIACCAIACSRNGGKTGLARVEASQGTPGGEVVVNVRLADDAPDIVTVISELRFDSGRFSLDTCAAGEDVGPGSGADKSFHYGQPAPGVVRAVLAGNMALLLPALSLYSCRLKVTPNTPPGQYEINLSGEAASAQFADLPYEASGAVIIGNS